MLVEDHDNGSQSESCGLNKVVRLRAVEVPCVLLLCLTSAFELTQISTLLSNYAGKSSKQRLQLQGKCILQVMSNSDLGTER